MRNHKELARNAGVSLKPNQIRWLDERAKQWGVRRSQALRRILDEYRANKKPIAK